MTVGELVTQRMLIKARQCGSGGTTGPEQTIGRVLIAPQQALRSLGIWDAEVLEGRVTDRQDCNGSYWVFETERGMWPDVYYDANVLGKRFRIIVLPAKGE